MLCLAHRDPGQTRGQNASQKGQQKTSPKKAEPPQTCNIFLMLPSMLEPNHSLWHWLCHAEMLNESNLFAARKTELLFSRESPPNSTGTPAHAEQRRQPSARRATGAWAVAQLQACSLSRMSQEIKSIFMFQLKHFTGVTPG